MKHPISCVSTKDGWLILQWPYLARVKSGDKLTIERDQFHLYQERGLVEEPKPKRKILRRPANKKLKRLEDKDALS